MVVFNFCISNLCLTAIGRRSSAFNKFLLKFKNIFRKASTGRRELLLEWWGKCSFPVMFQLSKDYVIWILNSSSFFFYLYCDSFYSAGKILIFHFSESLISSAICKGIRHMYEGKRTKT